jgi:hypothetical protein
MFSSSRFILVIVLVCLARLGVPTCAEAQSGAAHQGTRPGHGPSAPDNRFLSHRFQLAAHAPERPQLAFHFGLVQPILLHGFNAAVDVRYKRLLLSYSHGQGLDVTRFTSTRERAAGMTLREPWTTGGGIGVTLIDELWLMADLKVHRFEAELGAEQRGYTTITAGAELGYRLFLWRGLNVALVARYWPNVYASSGRGVVLHDKQGERLTHKPMQQGSAGFFLNVLVGWAFDL